MKTIISIVLLFVGSMVGIWYGSCYVMGGIEGGLPGGGNGHYADYHEGNLVTEFFQGGQKSPGAPVDYTPGNVSSNPFAE